MEPIISHWLIYLAGVADVIRTASLAGMVLLGGITWVLLFDKSSGEQYRRYGKYTGIAFIICLILATFIPAEKTVWMMIGASCVTPDNITAVQENLIEFAKQISQAIK